MDFLEGVIGALGQFGDQILGVILRIFFLLVDAISFVFQVLGLVFCFFVKIVGDIGKFFEHIWSGFFKGIVQSILKGVVKFGQFLHGIFAPVVKFLQQVSKFIDRIYNHYVKPILRVIRITRVALTLLRALGVKWAGKLDSILGKIQTDIQKGFLLIKGYLNTIIDLVNILADPTKLLRRPTTLLSIRRIFHAFIRQVTGLPPGFFWPSRSSLAPLGLGPLPAHFDPADPTMNPPPSYYLSLDDPVPSYEFLGPGDVIADTAVDDVGPIDYFADVAAFQLDCDDEVACMAQAGKVYAARA